MFVVEFVMLSKNQAGSDLTSMDLQHQDIVLPGGVEHVMQRYFRLSWVRLDKHGSAAPGYRLSCAELCHTYSTNVAPTMIQFQKPIAGNACR